MNDLRDNPVGMALAGFAGFVVLLGLVLAWLWTRPVTAPAAGDGVDVALQAPAGAAAVELEPISAYQVVTDRPLFSETRRPIVGEAAVEEVEEVKPNSFSPPPAARLTGIVITPERKIATLMPEDGGKPLLALEGEALEGDNAIWEVTSIQPRSIELVSRAGRTHKMELVVHDSEMAPPPKPELPPEAVDEDTGEAMEGEDGEPLSRAEQIRQRIAERREELRRQQEERAAEAAEQGQDEQAAARDNQQDARSQYMRTMQGMLRGRQQDSAGDDDTDNEEQGTISGN